MYQEETAGPVLWAGGEDHVRDNIRQVRIKYVFTKILEWGVIDVTFSYFSQVFQCLCPEKNNVYYYVKYACYCYSHLFIIE